MLPQWSFNLSGTRIVTLVRVRFTSPRGVFIQLVSRFAMHRFVSIFGSILGGLEKPTSRSCAWCCPLRGVLEQILIAVNQSPVPM